MFEFNQMNDILKPYCTCESIFDYYRLVDPKTHKILRYNNDDILEIQNGYCFESFDKKACCPNCVVKQASIKKRQFVKLEFLYGKVLLIVAKPINIKGKLLVLELIKDITSSMIGLNYYRASNKNVESVVSQFNELAVRDILTGLYNVDYIINYIDEFIEREATFNTLIGAAIDIDNYTQINSVYSYSFGNEVLQYIAGNMEKFSIAHGGITGRLGTDEFGIFFINKTQAEVEDICKELYNEVTQKPLIVQEQPLNISFKYAVTKLDEKEESQEFLEKLFFYLRAAQGEKQ